MKAATLSGIVRPGGVPSRSLADGIAAWFKRAADGLTGDDFRDVTVALSGGKRTTPQHRLWWRLMGEAALAMNEAGHRAPSGRPVLKDDLHTWAKWVVLPVAVQLAEADTTEPEEWEMVVYPPGHDPVVTRTTTRLSKTAFSYLIDKFLSSDLIAVLPLAGDEYRAAAGKVRSGRVDEPDHLRTMEVPAVVHGRLERPPRPGRRRNDPEMTAKRPGNDGQMTTSPATVAGQAHILDL